MQVVVRQISGLGNQLFQFAAGRYYSRRYNADLVVAVADQQSAFSHGSPRPFLLDQFNIDAHIRRISKYDRLMLTEKGWLRPLTSIIGGIRRVQVYTEPLNRRYTFLEDLPLQHGVETLYLAGYWQAHRIVDHVADELREEFSFKNLAQGKNLEVLNQIRASPSAVSLHVRRGDYTLAIEGNIALPMNYYAKAISAFKERLDSPTFFVFSDDIEFAKRHFSSDVRAVFVEHNDESNSHEDLRLMSACQHHIIANSTFSWWGAWLNPAPAKIVISPKYWHQMQNSYFPELLPTEWTLIDNLTAPAK